MMLLAVIASVLFFSFVNGSFIMRDTEDTIVTDGEWLVCPSDSPIAWRDFLLKRVQGRFSGKSIVGGLIEPAVNLQVPV